MPTIPVYCMYVWRHFWDLFEIAGEDFTMHDILAYQKMFAPSMSRSDMAQLLSMSKKASSYIRKLRNGDV